MSWLEIGQLAGFGQSVAPEVPGPTVTDWAPRKRVVVIPGSRGRRWGGDVSALRKWKIRRAKERARAESEARKAVQSMKTRLRTMGSEGLERVARYGSPQKSKYAHLVLKRRSRQRESAALPEGFSRDEQGRLRFRGRDLKTVPEEEQLALRKYYFGRTRGRNETPVPAPPTREAQPRRVPPMPRPVTEPVYAKGKPESVLPYLSKQVPVLW